MKFEKWQALGNDYLILESTELPWELTEARIEWLCDPHFGIGADGILLLAPSEDPEFVAGLRIFNPDGSEAELSGNGAREAILYLRRHGWTYDDEFAISTVAGSIRPTITGELTCSVDMGKASTSSKDFPSGGPDGRGTVRSAGREWEFQHVSIGNPQCAIVVDEAELADLDLERDRPRDRRPRALSQPHQRLLPGDRGQSGVGADLRARGGGDALLRHRRQRRRGHRLPARRAGARSRSSSTAASSRSRSARTWRCGLDGWAEPVYAGEAGRAARRSEQD